jgi:hypothetical protein
MKHSGEEGGRKARRTEGDEKGLSSNHLTAEGFKKLFQEKSPRLEQRKE